MPKPRKHIRHKKLHRLPVWIRSQEFRWLNRSQKDFLGWLYSMGPDTCWLWNCRLQKKFHCSRSTIQRWLRKLKELGFIWIEKPFGPERKIHTRLLPTPQHFVQLIGTLALNKALRKHKHRPRARRDFPPPIRNWHSKASIDQARRDIISELVHRGETFETAEKVANQVIEKSLEKKGDRGLRK